MELVAGVVSTMLVGSLAVGGCSSGSSSLFSVPASPGSGTVVVFAAASLKPAFTQISARFKTDHPGAGVDFDFAGSAELATQLTQGAVADVFAAADTAQMDRVTKDGLLAAVPTNFASNTLVIVTGPGNPQNINTFADLARSGLNVVICQRPVPCGSATHRIEDITSTYLKPVSEEPNVTDALNKVSTGQADAALVYVTDALNAGTAVTTVEVPEAADAVNTYPIAVLKEAPHHLLAQKFVALVASAPGQQILAQSGFAKP